MQKLTPALCRLVGVVLLPESRWAAGVTAHATASDTRLSTFSSHMPGPTDIDMLASASLTLSACLMRAVSWTLYGLVTSNLGKQENLLQLNNGQIVTVPEFLYDQFHYRHDMVGYIVLILAAFVAVFWTAGWAAFRYLNFNVSPWPS